jgi:hypothetical protein
MFLTAFARPRYNEDGICTFDGKIGMFPFVDYIPARRASGNSAQGVIVTTPFSVTLAIALIREHAMPLRMLNLKLKHVYKY